MANAQIPIVTEDMLGRWKSEDERLEAEERAIKLKRFQLKQLIEAGTNLSQGWIADSTQETRQDSQKQLTMKEAIVLFLSGVPTGCVAALVIDEMNKYSEYKERMQRNPNAVYSDLGELVRASRLCKQDNIYIHPKFVRVPHDFA